MCQAGRQGELLMCSPTRGSAKRQRVLTLGWLLARRWYGIVEMVDVVDMKCTDERKITDF